jgi:hypothetical protein
VADLQHLVLAAGAGHEDLVALAEHAVDHPDVDDHAAIIVEIAVEDQRLELGVGLALRRRDAFDDRFEDRVDTHAGLGAAGKDVFGRDADRVFDLHPRSRRGGRVAGRSCS